jgi:hypothetical protein
MKTMHTRRTRLTAIAVIGLATASAGACGGRDDSGAATVASDPTIAPSTTSMTTTEPTTIEPTTTAQPDTGIAVSYAYAYDPPDGAVDDLVDNFPANPPDPSNGQLGLSSAHGVTQVTGDLVGTMWYVFGSSEHPTGFATGGATASSISLFSGVVTDCGTGTAVIAESMNYPSGGDGEGIWRILEGYGTGELVKLTGSGTTVRRDGPDSGRGEVTGRISCDGANSDPDVTEPSGQPVSFGWSYQSVDNVTDPGGVPWQQAYGQSVVADPASGKLGLVHGHGTTTYVGDVAGTGRRVWLAVENPAGWLANAGTRIELTQFVGTVAGCGEGTMTILGTASFGPGTNNPEDLIDADYTWSILPGFGTGALQSADGQGTGVTSENATGGTATLQGNVACGN